MKIFLAFLLLLSLTSTAHAQWEQLQSPTSGTLHSLAVISRDSLIVVGDEGAIFFSSDGGKNWKDRSIPDIGNVYSITIHTPQRYWFACDSGLFNSADKGMLWYINVWSRGFERIWFVSDSIGFAAQHQQLLRTTDRGRHWDTVQIIGERKQSKIRDVHFTSSSPSSPLVGYAASPWSVLRTTDSGATWHVASAGWSNLDTLASVIETCYFFNDSIGLIGGWYNSLLCRTTNTGKDWLFVPEVGKKAPLLDFEFVSDKVGYGVGWSGTILKTIDSGNTWVSQHIPNLDARLYDVEFADSLTGYAVGDDGTILKTINGGGVTSSVSHQTVTNPLDIIKRDEGYLIRSVDANAIKIKVLDVQGRDVTSMCSFANESEQRIFVSGPRLPSGTYLIQAYDRESVRQGKIQF